jgi:hypothetical protein
MAGLSCSSEAAPWLIVSTRFNGWDLREPCSIFKGCRMKTLCRLAVNALLYLVTAALVLGAITLVGTQRMLTIYNGIFIVATGIAGMICVRCRLEGKPLGRLP